MDASVDRCGVAAAGGSRSLALEHTYLDRYESNLVDPCPQQPEELRDFTLELRKTLGGRKNVAYPLPVGAHSVTVSKAWKPRSSDVIVLTFHKTGTT